MGRRALHKIKLPPGSSLQKAVREHQLPLP
jgi:hypothetical protein